jgi:hypothetical protein
MIFTLGGALPLDEVSTTAYVAYGLRKLRNAYTGAGLRVINTANNAQGDISFDGNDEISLNSLIKITTVGTSGLTLNQFYSLSTFAGSSDVRVVTWYDQSGNDRHVTQSTAADRFFLMQGGSFRLIDNKPSIFKPKTYKGLLRFSGGTSNGFATHYNLISTYGPVHIVKYTADVSGSGTNYPGGNYFFAANSIPLWGSGGYITDSSSVSPPVANSTSTGGYYYFGIGNQGNSVNLSIAARSTPVAAELGGIGCSLNYTTTQARPYVALGGTIVSTSTHNGSGGRIVSIVDRFVSTSAPSPNKGVSVYFNGSFNSYRAQECSMDRWPLINASNNSFQIGNNASEAYGSGGELLGGGADMVDFAFQEFITFNGTGQHAERTIIERNMGRYYNITVS